MKSFLHWKRTYKQGVAVGVDAILLPLAFLSAIQLRYEGVDLALLRQYALLILAAPLVSIPIFVRLGLYRAVVRFIDQKIVGVVAMGVSLSVIAMAALVAFTHAQEMSRGVLGIYWLVAILYVLTSRFLVRGYIYRMHGFDGATRVVVYGAGEAGAQLLAALRTSLAYMPIALVDDNPEKQGTTINGRPVIAPDDLPQVIRKYGVTLVLLAIPSASHATQRRILDRLEPLRVRIQVTPPVTSLVEGQVRMQDLRDLEIEDLLGRDSVVPDEALLARGVVGRTVMVTGAGGSIGTELCRQILRRAPARLVLFERSEFALYSIEQELTTLSSKLAQRGVRVPEIVPLLGSVTDGARCEAILRHFEVDTVYHAAAYKHVPLVEHNPIEGIRNNVFGTLAVAEAAVAAGVERFVLISTDKAVRPTNVMGATKRLAELVLQGLARTQSATRFSMVRFGNVLDSSGSVVPLFRRQIFAGGPVTVTHPEVTRYFMTIPEAAQLVLQSAVMANGGDVFVLDMGEPVKILDLAKRMIHLSGHEVKSEDNPGGTIEIAHIGLRPGEKLYEELLIGDNVVGTGHPLILRAQEAELPWPRLQALLTALQKACAAADHATVRVVLRECVAEYAPQGEIEDLVWRTQAPRPAAPAVPAVVAATGAVAASGSDSAGEGHAVLH